MKEFIFNKKDYKSYKDIYEDLSIKLGRKEGLEDYYDISNYDYDPHCLYEDLKYGFDRTAENKFVFLNFDRDKIALQKNYDDYEYNMVFRIFEAFSTEYPNNQLEFRMEDEKK